VDAQSGEASSYSEYNSFEGEYSKSLYFSTYIGYTYRPDENYEETFFTYSFSESSYDPLTLSYQELSTYFYNNEPSGSSEYLQDGLTGNTFYSYSYSYDSSYYGYTSSSLSECYTDIQSDYACYYIYQADDYKTEYFYTQNYL
jgi:hypothetical protein